MGVRQDASTGQLIDDGKPAKTGQDAVGRSLHVRVYSPFVVYFDQTASSVSAENATGPFDILPQHHNFISLLKPGELVVHAETGPIKIKISGGLMRVHSNDVTVFLDV